MGRIEFQGIRKKFTDPSGRDFEALRGIDLSIESGESFSLLGPSGCGKSTLLRILSGLDHPDEGRVLIDGTDVTRLPPEKRSTAMVFQSYALFPHLSVEGNIAFGLKLRKLPSAEIARKVEAMLDLVQLTGLNRRRMDELSGGQQQRVALARVLAIEPKIILMDEPLSNLDAELRRTTRATIRRIQCELGLTLVYVTHDQEEALMISDRLALMRAGQIEQSGSPREIYELPATLDAARFIGQRNILPVFVENAGDGSCRLKMSKDSTESVTFTGMNMAPDHNKDGDQAAVALKGDSLSLAADGWSARVELISFAGAHLEVEASLISNHERIRFAIPSSDPASAKLRRGETVHLAIKPGTGNLYPLSKSA